MESRCFVICDKEQVYADGLALFLAKKIDFQIHVCSALQQVEMISKEQGIEILLIDESCLEESDSVPETGEMIVLAGDTLHAEEEKRIYKYQPADAILAEILSIFLKENHSGMVKQQLYRDSCLIGIYSPVHRVGKTAFAIAFGKEAAKKERVLYLNLEEYSGWKERYSRNETYTLADLLYYVRQEKSNLEIRLGIMTGEMEGLEYIAPMEMSEDLKMVSFEEWKDLLEQLLEQRIYKKIIIDFGECVQGLWKLLDFCQRIYMPVSHEPESLAKVVQFERNAELLGYGELQKKIIQLEFDGNMESDIRKLLKKEEEKK